jgi:hypothetical protein
LDRRPTPRSAIGKRSFSESEAAIFETAKAGAIKRSKPDRDRARADLNALGPAPLPPLTPRLTGTDPTFEGLIKRLGHGRRSIDVVFDEAGQFLGGHAMHADYQLETIAGPSKFSDGSPINRTRAGDGTGAYHGRRRKALVEGLGQKSLGEVRSLHIKRKSDVWF